jgi:hypothetical protein
MQVNTTINIDIKNELTASWGLLNGPSQNTVDDREAREVIKYEEFLFGVIPLS